MDILLDVKHSQKIWSFAMGFFLVMAVIFSFQFLSTKIPGLKDNYLNLFCFNIK